MSEFLTFCIHGVSIRLLLVDTGCHSVFETGGVTKCLRAHETKVLVWSHGCLEAGGGLISVICGHDLWGTLPMGNPELFCEQFVLLPSEVPTSLYVGRLSVGAGLLLVNSNKNT
jgi:hypothetical protein